MGAGIRFFDTSINSIACDIKFCKCLSNDNGIFIQAPSASPSMGFNIMDCIIMESNLTGIQIVRLENSIIQNCITQNNRFGITLTNGQDNTILRCISNQNDLDGINLSSNTNTCVKGNIANNNGGTGIGNFTATNNVFFLNKAQLNGTNFSGVDLVAIFSIGSGGFTVGPATAFDNISVVV